MAKKKTVILDNEDFINSLNTKLDLSNPKKVFGHVFSLINKKEVRIYPTENYYYFQFFANGKTLWGSFTLSASTRDKGILGFGYSEKLDRYRDLFFKAEGGGMALSAKDGVKVRKITGRKYSVTYKKKSVVFLLNGGELKFPKRAKILACEKFIGPCFDESGLQFYLVFNKNKKCFYWILDEDVKIPEIFVEYGDGIVIGNRTEYAFYDDKPNNRKILIGVEGFNVLQNNWYDGPFDQMPDNYVYERKINLKYYIEECYPNLKDEIDDYGNYVHEKGSRVAVAPYTVYFSKNDLFTLIDSCKKSRRDSSEFYACITRSEFKVPENLGMSS